MRRINAHPVPFWKTATFRPLVLSAAFGVIMALATYGVKTGLTQTAATTVSNATLSATAHNGFAINDILVEGRDHTPIDDLRAAVNLKLGDPILSADPAYLKTRIEALPWVAQASVERRLPDTLYIRLNEHRAMALWQNQGTLSLINPDGEVILTGGEDIKVFAHLPLVVGNGAPEHTADLLAMLAEEPELNAAVKAAVRVSDRRWDVMLENGNAIRLPELNAADAWSKLARYSETHGLLDANPKSVDLRLPDRILVKFDDEETIRKPVMGQNT